MATLDIYLKPERGPPAAGLPLTLFVNEAFLDLWLPVDLGLHSSSPQTGVDGQLNCQGPAEDTA